MRAYIGLMVDINAFHRKYISLPPLVSSPCQTQNQGKNNKINKVEKQKRESKNQSAEGTMAIYIIRSASSFPFPSSSAYGKWSRIEKKKKKMLQKKKYIRQGKKNGIMVKIKLTRTTPNAQQFLFQSSSQGMVSISRGTPHPTSSSRTMCQILSRFTKEKKREKKQKGKMASCRVN